VELLKPLEKKIERYIKNKISIQIRAFIRSVFI